MTAPASTPGPSRALFVATILTGSFLLFLIQPMVARLALPRLGGAPNVWNSAMLVYQALLLAGYWYAHRLSHLPLQRQSRLHLILYAVALATLPVGLVDLPAPPPGSEVFWVPALLALSIGPVFFLVSAQAPLMQRWYALHPQAGEPWALYAASNLGSFAGLIAYPLLVEPLLPLAVQGWAWSAGYALLLVLIALSARARRGLPQVAEVPVPHQRPPARQLALWIVLAAVPSGLMLSTTTHLTTDIFAMPLLWVIPLGIYLLSFVIAFADRRGPARAVSALAWLAVLSIGGLAMVSQGAQGLLPVLASVGLLFFVCVALHARLYDLRPPAEGLTGFYLAMSLGGALGGLFTALVAPLAFDWAWEHPLLVFAAALLLPRPALLDWARRGDLAPALRFMALGGLVVAAGVLAKFLYDANAEVGRETAAMVLSSVLALVGLALVPWRALALGVLGAAMLVQGGLQTIKDSRDGLRTRSYFGIYTVRDYPSEQQRTLAHGTTLHGRQSTDPAARCLPLTYYGPGSGAGIAFANASRLVPGRAMVGVVGLGTGSLLGYARPGQSWTVFEIDETVLDLSRQGKFTYLSGCAPGAQIVLGDARLKLGQVRPGTYDLLAIDAFSSDSIPLHLFTHEAFGVYMQALAPRGVLVVHISNRFMDLEPALAAAVKARGLHAAVREDNPPDQNVWTGSTWVAITRDPARLDELAKLAPAMPFRPLKPPAQKLWTDDHASILPYVTWANFLGKQ
ncbi:MAG: hypothetical protein GXC70_06270 [Sphingomonadaceae bacterium]|nr:hypothetical protein [Sphingomonadaceae bacterium]